MSALLRLMIFSAYNVITYSSGPNNHVHTPIYFSKKNPANMALLGTTRLLVFKENLILLYVRSTFSFCLLK